MPRCLVSFGANLGDASGTIRAAAERLRVKIAASEAEFRLSRFFRTPPVGGPSGQPPFVNAVVAISTNQNVWQMWDAVRHVETELGRTRNQRWEARPIDIDILLFEDLRIWTPQFKIPHPRMCMRRFILAPAVDVARDWIDPVTSQSIQQLFENLRHGPGNLKVMSSEKTLAIQFLQEAARQASANWLDISNSSCPRGDRRWVAITESLECGTMDEKASRSKLLVALARPMQIDGVSWEDFSRPLAVELNLSGNAPNTDLVGPRYLLPSDDPEWAVHELVAALDAMDCPVEPIE